MWICARINYNHCVRNARYFIDSGILANTSSQTTYTHGTCTHQIILKCRSKHEKLWEKKSEKTRKRAVTIKIAIFLWSKHCLYERKRFGTGTSYFSHADIFSDNRNIGKSFFFACTPLSRHRWNNRLQYVVHFFCPNSQRVVAVAVYSTFSKKKMQTFFSRSHFGNRWRKKSRKQIFDVKWIFESIIHEKFVTYEKAMRNAITTIMLNV